MNNSLLIDVLYYSEVRVPIRSRLIIRNLHGLKAVCRYFILSSWNATRHLLEAAACLEASCAFVTQMFIKLCKCYLYKKSAT